MRANSRAIRDSWVKSAISAPPAPGYCSFTATSRPSDQTARWTWPMLRRGRRRVVEGQEPVAPAAAELLVEHPVHRRDRHRRRGFLQPGQRLAVRGGDVFGQRRLEHRQRLAELHRAALELAEHGEQLLGGARLQFGGHLGRRTCR